MMPKAGAIVERAGHFIRSKEHAMPIFQPYHCLNCGHDFATEILTKDEAEKARDKGDNVGPVRCPQCGRTDLQKRQAAA